MCPYRKPTQVDEERILRPAGEVLLRNSADAWAMTNPVGTKKESPKWSNWNMGGAWLVQTLWDHYVTYSKAMLTDSRNI